MKQKAEKLAYVHGNATALFARCKITCEAAHNTAKAEQQFSIEHLKREYMLPLVTKAVDVSDRVFPAAPALVSFLSGQTFKSVSDMCHKDVDYSECPSSFRTLSVQEALRKLVTWLKAGQTKKCDDRDRLVLTSGIEDYVYDQDRLVLTSGVKDYVFQLVV